MSKPYSRTIRYCHLHVATLQIFDVCEREWYCPTCYAEEKVIIREQKKAKVRRLAQKGKRRPLFKSKSGQPLIKGVNT